MHSTSGETASGPFTMRWREEGPDLDGTRQVLLLHGLYAGAHSFEWRRLVPILAERFRVRVPDLLGSTTSDRPDLDYTRAIVQSAVEELIGDMESDAIVVGSSLTGAYALGAIARQPVRRPLLLITPSGMGISRVRQPSAVKPRSLRPCPALADRRCLRRCADVRTLCSMVPDAQDVSRETVAQLVANMALDASSSVDVSRHARLL